MLKSRSLCLGGVFFLLAVLAAWAGEIQVDGAWIRSAPPSAKALAAYMVITNTAGEPVTLVGADSPDFSAVEMHQSMAHQGMMRMMAVEHLEIAPGKSLTLAPGGYHLMLMEPHKVLKSGDHVLLRLQFDTGEELSVSAVVQPRAMMAR